MLERLSAGLDSLARGAPVIARYGLQLALAAAAPPEQSLEISRGLRAEALASGHPTVALSALVRLADALRRTGAAGEAAASARAASAESAESSWHDIPDPEFWWLVFQALDAGGCTGEALEALQRGADWVRRCVARVPAEYRESFLHRSRVVPELLAMAKRRLGA